MSRLANMKARNSGGSTSMRNDSAAVKKSQQPANSDPTEVSPSPSDTQDGEGIQVKLPKALESESHKHGESAAYLAHGHHVKNSDGSTSFKMKSLDGEPVTEGDLQSPANSTDGDASGGSSSGDYGLADMMKSVGGM